MKENTLVKNDRGFRHGWNQSILNIVRNLSLLLGFPFFFLCCCQAGSFHGCRKMAVGNPRHRFLHCHLHQRVSFFPKVPGKVSTLNHWPSWVICPTLRLSLCSNNEIPNWPDMVPWVGVNCTQITWIESGERWLPKEIMELSLEEGGLDLGQ